MRIRRSLRVAAVLFPLALILLLLAAVTSEPGPSSPPAPSASSAAVQVARIRSHLDSARTELPGGL